jgi:hypothetical protein
MSLDSSYFRGSSVSLSDLSTEAKYSLSRFNDNVEIVAYNPLDCKVSHLVVLFSKPEEHSNLDSKTKGELKSICMILENPELRMPRGRFEVDFEKAFEDLVVSSSLPYNVETRQKRTYLAKPKEPYLVLDHFGVETGADFEEYYKRFSQMQQSFKDITESLESRLDFVYSPKKILPRSQMIFDEDGGIVRRKSGIKQTLIDALETKKYQLKTRRDDRAIVIPDVFYILPNVCSNVLAELKPWSVTREEIIWERFEQLKTYDALLRYHEDETMPIALVLPTLSTNIEFNSLENLQKIINRPIYVFSIAERESFIKNLKEQKKGAQHAFEVAKRMGLGKSEKMFGRTLDEIQKELNWYQRAVNNFV